MKKINLTFFILFAVIGAGFFFSLAHQAHAAISFVQSTSTVPSPNDAPSVSKAFGSAVAKGDLIVVSTFNGIGDTVTATDTLGDTFVVVALSHGSSDHDENILIATTSAAGADTVTVNDSPGGIYAFSIHEYSGTLIDTVADIVDASSTNYGSGASLSPGNITTHNANDLVFAYFATGDDNAGTTFTYGGGYTARELASGITGFCAAVYQTANCIASEDATFASATTTNPTATIDDGGDYWTAAAIAIKTASFSSPAIAYVNKVSKASSTATTCVLPVMTGASVGNTLIVTAQVKTATTTTATTTDTNGNSWVTAKRATSTAGSDFIFYAPITALSSGKTTSTVTFSSSVTNSCQEALFSGLALTTSTLLDFTTSTSGGTTALKSGTSTTNYSDELLIGGGSAAPTSTTFAAGSGFTMVATSTLGAMEYKIVSSAGSYSAPMTLGASTTWIGAVAAFRAPPDAVSITYTTGGDGGMSGAAETITGTNFGTVSSGNRATCSGGSGTGCINFIVGGNATVAASSISSWTDTSITFTVSSTLASNGGVDAVQVSAASSTDSTPPTFYIYPNITSVQALNLSGLVSIPNARTYNAADTDGLIMLQGDHFGTSGASTILGSAATQYNSTGGSCTTGGYTTSTACFEVPATIPINTYSGTIVLSRGSDSKQATTSLNILPRITALNPTSTSIGNTVQILGDHLCEGGTCPTSANWTSSSFNVKFGVVTSTSFVAQTGGAGACNGSGAAWTDGEICVTVPSGLSVGSATTTVISNTASTNMFAFTVTTPSPPGTPGTPTYTNVGSTMLTVNWSASSGGVSYYTPERSTSSAFTSPTTLATTTVTSMSDSGLAPNTTYYYEVYATNAAGNSSSSATSSVLTLPATPGTPTFSNVSTSTLTVNWTTPTNGAAYYTIERLYTPSSSISLAQSNLAAGSGSGATTQTVLLSNESSTDLNVVAVSYCMDTGCDAAPTVNVAVTDSEGNTYTMATSTTAQDLYNAIFYAPNVAGGSDTITLQASSSVVYLGILASEWKGVATLNPLDQVGSNNAGSGSTYSVATNATTSIAPELIYTMENDSGSQPTVQSPFTLLNNNSSGGFNDAYLVTSTIAKFTASWTGPNTSWQALTATFMPKFTVVGTTTASFYADTGLNLNSTYYYYVFGTNSTGAGGNSFIASTSTVLSVNSPPNAPTENAPTGGAQDISTAPTFTLTATDPDSNNIEYRLNLYSGGSCAGSVTTYNQNSSQTGWSGQNASSSREYSSGTQGSYAASGLTTNTTYSWTSNAIDPEGSNTWGATSTCANFTTTYGSWTTDAGSWSINGSNQLAVTPAAATTTQIHVTNLTKTSYIVEFQAKSGGSFSEYRDSVSGGTPTALLGGSLSVSGSSILSGGSSVGLTASSTGGTTTFNFDDFAVYTGTTISMANLPSGGSWGVLNASGSFLSGTCQTGSTWNISSYSSQVPINQDNGGGYVAVWTNGGCTGTPSASTTLEVGASGIFGGDTYSYGSGSGIILTGGTTPTETSTITVNAVGTVSY